MSETEQIIETITAALRGAHGRLWTIEDICAHFSCGKSTVYRISAKPGFPESVKIPGVDGRRWVAEEVREWAKQQRSSKQRGPGRPRLIQS
jgi:predicted DNA-binding transcriptional regulator AlpA